MAEPLIACEGVSYRYPAAAVPVLRQVGFAVEAGEFVLLAGASGSGKSTLCRLMNGLIPHLHGGELRGELRVAGADPRRMPPHRLSRAVGLLLQRPEAQCVAATVARDIAFGPACQGLDRATVADRVRAAVERLDIAHLLDRAPHRLSGGEQQRVALAGLLASEPRLLVLDEPFAFLDAAGADRLRELLVRLNAAGITLLVAEHRLDEVADLAGRMLVLHEGRLVADAAPQKVLAGSVAAWGLEPAGSRQGSPPPPPPSAAISPVVEWDAIWCERDGNLSYAYHIL